MSKTLEFLEAQEINFTPVSSDKEEVIVNPCPFCGSDKGKLYVNTVKGLFDCKRCQEKGNLFKLKKAYGVVEGVQSIREKEGKSYKKMDDTIADDYHKALWEHPEALKYLYDRGFNDETITHFNVGYKSDHEGQWITIPHYEDFDLWNIKSRRFAGGDKTFRRVNGQPTVLFGADDIDYSKNAICLVESETDLMACRQMGVMNSVGFTAGADTFKPEWLEIFSQFEHVYILLNSDEAGQKGARKVAEKIGLGRCKNIVLPVNDVNDFLIDPDYSANDFKLLFSKATKFDVRDITDLRHAVESLDDWYRGADGAMKGISSGYETIDKFTHGFQKQDLIIFTGDSGVGKTTFVNNMVMSNIYSRTPCLGFYLEGQFNYYLSRMISAHEGIVFAKVIDSPEWETIKNKVVDLPLYLYTGAHTDLSLEKLKEVIIASVQLYEIRVVMIDNLQRLVRGEVNYTRKVSDAVEILKDLATDLNITIVLIAHVTKGNAQRKMLSMHDLKDSSTIFQSADKVFILQKVKDDMFLTIEKNRMGEDDINIAFTFEADVGRFVEKNGVVTKSVNIDEVPIVKAQQT